MNASLRLYPTWLFAGDLWALGVAAAVLLSGGLAPFSASLLAEQARRGTVDAVQDWLVLQLDAALGSRLGCSNWMQVLHAAPAHCCCCCCSALLIQAACDQETLGQLLQADPAQRGSALQLARRCHRHITGTELSGRQVCWLSVLSLTRQVASSMVMQGWSNLAQGGSSSKQYLGAQLGTHLEGAELADEQVPVRAMSFQRRRQSSAYEELVPPRSLSSALSTSPAAFLWTVGLHQACVHDVFCMKRRQMQASPWCGRLVSMHATCLLSQSGLLRPWYFADCDCVYAGADRQQAQPVQLQQDIIRSRQQEALAQEAHSAGTLESGSLRLGGGIVSYLQRWLARPSRASHDSAHSPVCIRPAVCMALKPHLLWQRAAGNECTSSPLAGF